MPGRIRLRPQSVHALLGRGAPVQGTHCTHDHLSTGVPNLPHLRLFARPSLAVQSRRGLGTSVSKAAQPAPSPSPSSTPSRASAAAAAAAATAPAAGPSQSQPSNAGASISEPLPDLQEEEDGSHIDWSKSFHGLSSQPFSKEIADILLRPIDPEDVEIKPDGIIFLPEIKYRRILNRAFGPGGWGLAPRSETIVTDKSVTREYALLAHGRLISIARGEQDYFSKDGVPTASEGCKSNAMMRCCKDLGIASELWDPRFIRKFKASHAREVFVEHQVNKKKTKIWVRKGDPVSYPWRETKFGA